MTHRRAIRLVFACWMIAVAALLVPLRDGSTAAPERPAGTVDGPAALAGDSTPDAHLGHSLGGPDPLTTVALGVNVLVLLGIGARLARPAIDDDT